MLRRHLAQGPGVEEGTGRPHRGRRRGLSAVGRKCPNAEVGPEAGAARRIYSSAQVNALTQVHALVRVNGRSCITSSGESLSCVARDFGPERW